MTHPEQSPDVAHNEPSVHGDVIQTEIGEHAQTVAAGKNIIQIIIDKLNLPPWLLYSTAVSLLVAAGSLGWFGYLSLVPGIPVVLLATPTPTLTPIPSATPSPTPTLLPFAPEAEGEVLIIIATFNRVEGVPDSQPHAEIQRAIQNEAKALGFANLRVEISPTTLPSDDYNAADTLGEQYNASLVIWGEESSVRMTINFFNRKEPDFEAAKVQVTEIERVFISALAKPESYISFITKDLPKQFIFLAFFAIAQSYFIEGKYDFATHIMKQGLQEFPIEKTTEGVDDAYYLLGKLHFLLGKFSDSIEYFSQAIKLNTNHKDSYILRGFIYLLDGKNKKALEDAEQAIALSPNNPLAYFLRSFISSLNGDHQQAIIDAVKVNEISPDTQLGYALLASVSYLHGEDYPVTNQADVVQFTDNDFSFLSKESIFYSFLTLLVDSSNHAQSHQQILRMYNQVIEILPNFSLLYLVRGVNYLEAGYYQGAVRDFDSAIQNNLNATIVYYYRGLAYENLDDYNSAITNYNQAVLLNPNFALAYHQRGNAYSDLKQYEQAIADYNKAIELDPDDATAYNNRGWAYYKQEQVEQAIADYTKAIELDPDDATAYNNRGLAYADQEQVEQAIADYNKAIELNHAPLSWPYNNRGNAYYDQEQYEQALADYTKAIELDPDYAPAYYNRGLAYADQEQFEQAIADYTKAIELNHDPLSWPYNNRGNAYYDQEQYEQALADYTKAIELDPDYAPAYYNRGLAYGQFEQYEQALADYTKAIELGPKDAPAYYNRGLAYENLGQYSTALDDYRTYTKLAPDDPDSWNKVCWWGSLTGVAADVLSACEQAVRLSNGVQWVLDSRGLARALTGDIEGAIVDFTAYVEWSKENDAYELYGKKREAWIAALQRGENPFDGATLAELRKE